MIFFTKRVPCNLTNYISNDKILCYMLFEVQIILNLCIYIEFSKLNNNRERKNESLCFVFKLSINAKKKQVHR